MFHVPLPPSATRTTEEVGGRTNGALNTVVDWIQQEGSRLSLALDKTEAILCTRRYKYVPLWLALSETPLKDSMAYLGLIIDHRMSFRPHIASAAKRVHIMDLLVRLCSCLARFLGCWTRKPPSGRAGC